MADETSKPKLAVVTEDLDEDEIEFKKLRRDFPSVKGASAIGIVRKTWRAFLGSAFGTQGRAGFFRFVRGRRIGPIAPVAIDPQNAKRWRSRSNRHY